MSDSNYNYELNEKYCENCKRFLGYDVADDERFCNECKTKFIKYPIPKWLIGASIILICIVIFQLTKFPDGLKYRKSLHAANKAFDSKHYTSAMAKYEEAKELGELSLEANGKLFVCYVRNEEYNKGNDLFNNNLAGESVSNDELYDMVDYHLSELEDVFEVLDTNKKFDNLYDEIGELTLQEQESKLIEFTQNNSNDYLAYYYLSRVYYELQDYQQAIRIDKLMIQKKPSLSSRIYADMGDIYRQLDDYQKSYNYYNKALVKNMDDIVAISGKARTKIKDNKYDEALEELLLVDDILTNNTYYNETLALAYHFNNMEDKAKEIMEKNINDKDFDSELLISIFNNESEIY
jgi:tetratricopeptide (TPR) repeat protein